jgi:hypothetical protein
VVLKYQSFLDSKSDKIKEWWGRHQNHINNNCLSNPTDAQGHIMPLIVKSEDGKIRVCHGSPKNEAFRRRGNQVMRTGQRSGQELLSMQHRAVAVNWNLEKGLANAGWIRLPHHEVQTIQRIRASCKNHWWRHEPQATSLLPSKKRVQQHQRPTKFL